jgi:hypothetical protein
MNRNCLLTLVSIWAAWSVTILGFQTLVDTRFQPERPDYATMWSPAETTLESQDDYIYLNEPFMNRQVSWDSEYYLSIAVVGYGDDQTHSMRTRSGRRFPLNYAFFPLYPYTIRAVSAPLSLAGMNPIATAALAGVIVSLLGTLAGMIALYDITRDEMDEDGGIRTAFYFLIFPSSFFLAMVYTEGLFAGLAFGSLALMRRRQFLIAGVLAALATWTRSIGLVLAVPLAIAFLSCVDWKALRSNTLNRRLLLQYTSAIIAILLPIGAYLIWQRELGREFTMVQEQWFGRKMLDFENTFAGFQYAVDQFISGEFSPMRAYYLLDFAAVLLALVACLFTLRRYPGIALFGLAALFIPLTTGYPQSLIRYVLVIPSLFIFLGRLGRSPAFDRVWTLVSVMLLSMQTALFAWDMWVA